MTNREIINNNIKKVLAEKGKSIRWLAEELDTNPSTLYTFLNRHESKKIDLGMIEDIAESLGISANDLFEGTSVEKSEMVKASRLVEFICAEMDFAQNERVSSKTPVHEWYYNGILQGLSLALMYIEGEQELEAEKE